MFCRNPPYLVPATESTNKKSFGRLEVWKKVVAGTKFILAGFFGFFWALFRLIVPVLSKKRTFFEFFLGFRSEISTGTKHEIFV